MAKEERKQDVWTVEVTNTANGITLSTDRGVIDLPRVMTAFDAADYAVRIGVRDAVKGDTVVPGHTVTARILGREAHSPGKYIHQCTAFAVYDADRDAFMRQEPWRGDGCQAEVKDAEGAKLLTLS